MAPAQQMAGIRGIERLRAKWAPFRVEKTRQNQNLEPSPDSTRTGRALMLGCAVMALLAAIAVAAVFAVRLSSSRMHVADAESADMVKEGKKLYAANCAGCHGRRLQGQLLWQVQDEFVGRRAPAHDQTGHTWQHSDEDLFHITKFGRFVTTPSTVKSYMPAYAQNLGDDQILATIAYIKATWPLGLRVSQALLNPGYAGMPRNASTVEWRLPPTCQAALQRGGSSVGFSLEGLPQRKD
jgi:S-disulfanyl-L-cysteine oxidoreductase SoxD